MLYCNIQSLITEYAFQCTRLMMHIMMETNSTLKEIEENDQNGFKIKDVRKMQIT